MKKVVFIALIFISAIGFTQEKHSFSSIISQQFIFTPQLEHAHGSSVVALPNGDLLACWFQGSGERTADDVRIMGARLEKGKTSWGVPFLMADTPGLPDCNPVLFLNRSEKLFLVSFSIGYAGEIIGFGQRVID